LERKKSFDQGVEEKEANIGEGGRAKRTLSCPSGIGGGGFLLRCFALGPLETDDLRA